MLNLWQVQRRPSRKLKHLEANFMILLSKGDGQAASPSIVHATHWILHFGTRTVTKEINFKKKHNSSVLEEPVEAEVLDLLVGCFFFFQITASKSRKGRTQMALLHWAYETSSKRQAKWRNDSIVYCGNAFPRLPIYSNPIALVLDTW